MVHLRLCLRLRQAAAELRGFLGERGVFRLRKRHADGQTALCKDERQKARKRLGELFEALFEVVSEVSEEAVVGQHCLLVVRACRRQIGGDAHRHAALRGAHDARLQDGAALPAKFLKALLVGERALGQDFRQEREKFGQIAPEGARTHAEHRHAGIRLAVSDGGGIFVGYAARMEVREIRQLGVRMALGIDRTQKVGQQEEILDVFLRHALRIEIEVDVGDLVREDVAVKHLAALDLALGKRQFLHFPTNIGEFKKRDRCQGFRRLGAFLPLLQALVHLDDALDLLVRERLLLLFQRFGKRRLALRGKRLARLEHDERTMRILHEVLFQDLFKVAPFESFAHLLKKLLIIEVKRRVGVVEPAVHDLDVVDKPLGERAEVRLTRLEFEAVDRRFEQRLVDAVLNEAAHRLFRQAAKLLGALRLRIRDDDAQIRLAQRILKGSADILADLRIHQHFFEGSSLRLQESVLQDFKSEHRLGIIRLPHEPV